MAGERTHVVKLTVKKKTPYDTYKGFPVKVLVTTSMLTQSFIKKYKSAQAKVKMVPVLIFLEPPAQM